MFLLFFTQVSEETGEAALVSLELDPGGVLSSSPGLATPSRARRRESRVWCPPTAAPWKGAIEIRHGGSALTGRGNRDRAMPRGSRLVAALLAASPGLYDFAPVGRERGPLTEHHGKVGVVGVSIPRRVH